MANDPDILDRASKLEQELTAAYVDSVRAKARPEQTQNPDGSWPHPECTDCDLPIEAGRLAIGKIRCFACQTQLEHQTKLKGRPW